MTFESLNVDNLLNNIDTSIIQSTEIPSSNITSGEMTGDLFITKGFLRSKDYVDGSAGWTVNDDGTAQFSDITLIGGILKFGKTSFADTVNAGYYISSDGIYFGNANDASYIKYDISGDTFTINADVDFAKVTGATKPADNATVNAIFAQDSIPTSLAIGDLWTDTDNNNKMYRAESVGADQIIAGEWVLIRDDGIAQAISDASTAQTTADSKIITFYQDGEPTAEATGDLWIDTNDGNKLYRWTGSAWTEIQDDGIATALSNASTAQSTADGKIVSFYATAAPTAEGTGDLWFDTDDDNKPYRWSGSVWVDINNPTEWASVGDAGGSKPDANATLGATWDSNITGQPTTASITNPSYITATKITTTTIETPTITAGTITGTTISGGTLQTASSGKRIEITNSNQLRGYGSYGASPTIIQNIQINSSAIGSFSSVFEVSIPNSDTTSVIGAVIKTAGTNNALAVFTNNTDATYPTTYIETDAKAAGLEIYRDGNTAYPLIILDEQASSVPGTLYIGAADSVNMYNFDGKFYVYDFSLSTPSLEQVSTSGKTKSATKSWSGTASSSTTITTDFKPKAVYCNGYMYSTTLAGVSRSSGFAGRSGPTSGYCEASGSDDDDNLSGVTGSSIYIFRGYIASSNTDDGYIQVTSWGENSIQITHGGGSANRSYSARLMIIG